MQALNPLAFLKLAPCLRCKKKKKKGKTTEGKNAKCKERCHPCLDRWDMTHQCQTCHLFHDKEPFQRISAFPSVDWQRHLAWRSPAAILMHVQPKEARRHTELAVKLYHSGVGGESLSASLAVSSSGFAKHSGRFRTRSGTAVRLGRACGTSSARAQRHASRLTRSSSHLSKCPPGSVYVSRTYALIVRLDPAAHSSHTSAAWFPPLWRSLAAFGVGDWASLELLLAVFTQKHTEGEGHQVKWPLRLTV